VDLEKKLAQLFIRIDALETEVISLKNKNASLEKDKVVLQKRIDSLESKLHKKNSSNSSIPPSKDENRIKPNQSLRIKTNKKTGGQKGHRGTTLKMQDNVDRYVDHKSSFCSCCSERLRGEHTFTGRRQVIDIPPIQPTVTEHRIYSTVCSCGKTTTSTFPNDVTSPISYGSTAMALTGYLSVGQYLPMKRIVEVFEHMFNIKLSQGTICNMLTKLTKQCMPAYLELRNRLERSTVVGSDETGCVVNGKKWWMWVWQNTRLTYIAASPSRGYQAILDNFPQGFIYGTLLSDCWAAQLKTPSPDNQICLAHIQRELKYFIESDKNKWSKKLLNLIYTALSLRRKILSKPNKDFSKIIEKVQGICSLLLRQITAGPQKLQALKNRLLKHETSIWLFLDKLDVPPDNNGSERAIRNVKVKQKISGQFRSATGAIQFAVLRSIYDTARKNNSPAYDAFIAVANFAPE